MELPASSLIVAQNQLLWRRVFRLCNQPCHPGRARASAPGWTQPEYLAFWETLLRTRIASVFFNENWQYSSGCVFEFAVALDDGLPTFDAHGTPLGLATGIALIEHAVDEMAADGIALNSLPTNLTRLRELQGAARKG